MRRTSLPVVHSSCGTGLLGVRFGWLVVVPYVWLVAVGVVGLLVRRQPAYQAAIRGNKRLRDRVGSTKEDLQNRWAYQPPMKSKALGLLKSVGVP